MNEWPPPQVAAAPTVSPALPNRIAPAPSPVESVARRTVGTVPGPLAALPPSQPLRSTVAPGIVMLAMYWATTATVAVMTLAITDRYRLLRGVVSGERGASAALDRAMTRADHRVLVDAMAALCFYVLGGIATAVWSRIVASNIVALHNNTVNVGLATWAWFVPIVQHFAGFTQLRKAHGAEWPVYGWQAGFAVIDLLAWVYSKVDRFATLTHSSGSSIVVATDHLQRNAEFAIVFFLCVGVTALLASRAVIEVHRSFRAATNPA